MALGFLTYKEVWETLEELWQRIKDEQFGYHDTEGDGMFERLDIINGGLRDDTIKRDRWW